MRAILPGRPQAKLQAVTTGLWENIQIIAYVSGNALVILGGPNDLLQTTYHDDETSLVAVALEEGSGKIAACSETRVYVYRPYGQEEGEPKWSLQCELPIEPPGDTKIGPTLSWGDSDELLVGSSALAFYSTDTAERQWIRPLASPVKFARFSYDASLIASTGAYDRFVKIWRRLSFATTTYSFDHAYLAHPATVTGLYWRRPFHKDQHVEPVLYTICADNKLRMWTGGDPHVLRLWTHIDLGESIQTRLPTSSPQPSTRRYAFIVDSRDFAVATERAVQQASNDGKDQHALDHLIEVAHRTPDICVVLDNRGNMSAWGLESVDCKAREGHNGTKTKNHRDPFNVAHVEGLRFRFARDPDPNDDNVQFFAFCGDKKNAALTILVHYFDGRLEWLEGQPDRLFDPAINERRLQRKTVWTGHSHPFKKVTRTASGRALVSRTQNSESIVWVQKATELGMTIQRHSVCDINEHIHRTAVLRDGDFVVHLHHGAISLWDTRAPKAQMVARREYHVRGKPLCLIVIPETKQNRNLSHLATVSSEMRGVAWEVCLPADGGDSNAANGDATPSLRDFGSFDLGSGDDLAYVLPVDPAGSDPVISGFLDTFARDVAISYTTSGVLKSWTARVHSEKRQLDWLLTSTVETSINNPSLASGTSIRKAALVDEKMETLTIWNMRSSQLEYEQTFEGQGVIQDLDWSSTPDNQSILAVGFPHKVVIYTQLRYDYLERGPSWAPVREISTRELTPHPIGDSVWLGNGSLVIGAGSQLFIQDENVDVSESLLPDVRLIRRKDVTMDIFSLASHLNGPLAVYHPQFLTQCILAGKLTVVQRVLVSLFKTLKFFTEGDELDSFLGFSMEEFFQDHEDRGSSSRRDLTSSYADFYESENEVTVTEEVAASLNELLTTKRVPHLSSAEQFRLADVVECVGMVERHRRSVDENAARFLVFFRQHALRAGQQSSSPARISWREIAWAYHSQSQDILVDLVTRHFHGKLLWPHARESGMLMWLTDAAALKAQFEVIARNEYTKSDDKNPVDCSLFYLALRKKAVLAGLWRMASWNREQQSTQRFLSNNFQEPRWRKAALKNAYALMGKRRFEYAAAFFLLGDALRDAVSVIAGQMDDMQLAIAVARVYEGSDDGPVLRRLLEERVLPLAVRDGNRWLATWAFWMLARRDKAVRALVTPLSHLVSSASDSPTITPQARLFLADDPALVVLYRQLREKSLQTIRGAVAVTASAAELAFVQHTARLYGRMGCDALALDLVRSWEFLAPPPPPAPPSHASTPRSPAASVSSLPYHRRRSSANYGFPDPTSPTSPSPRIDGMDFDPRKLLRRRGSLVVADLPTHHETVRSPGPAVDGDIDEEPGEGEGGAVNGVGGKTGDVVNNEKDKDGKGKPQPPATQFQEPTADSLLDSFGF